MENLKPRWSLSGPSSNSFGVTFFSLSSRDVTIPDADYEELMELLKRTFGAEEVGELRFPYAIHKYLKVQNFCLGLILDSPEWLDLYARDERDIPALEPFVYKVVAALNNRIDRL